LPSSFSHPFIEDITKNPKTFLVEEEMIFYDFIEKNRRHKFKF